MNFEAQCRKFIRIVEENALFVEGIAVADETGPLFEHDFVPKKERNIYSHTKSFSSIAIGIAVAEGALSLGDRVAEFFPERLPASPDARIMEITLKDLLMMSSGFGGAYLMSDDRRLGVGYPDYIAYLFSRPMREAPGTRFCYSNGDTYLACKMAEKALKMPFRSFLYERMFRPLGLGYPVVDTDPEGSFFGASGLQLGLADMMSLGVLCLNGGVWKGERIVPAEWIAEATKRQIDTPTANGDPWCCGYGYQFWCSPYPGSYRADGAYGQITTVLPHSGLAVAVQCPEHGDFGKVRPALDELLSGLA